MISTSLIFTTLLASLSVVAADSLYVPTPTNLVQCANTTISWSGGTGPYSVYVFTDCKDTNDDPIGQFLNVTSTNVTWWINQPSGAGIFVQVEDATGVDIFSNDGYIGGSTTDTSACMAEVSSLSQYSATHTATSSASSASSSSADIPTTLSGSHTTSSSAGGNIVNAAKGASTASTAKATGSSLPAANSALGLTIRPLEIGVGLVAVGLAALL